MFRTENTGSETYLTYMVQKHEVIDELSLGMLTNNKVPGLLTTSFYKMDEEQILRYHISSKVTLESYLAGTISRKKLLTIFKSITGAFLSSEEYMLESFQLRLNVADIYVNVSNSEAYLVCLPLKTTREMMDIRKFFKEVLFSSRFETGENGDYLLALSNYLNSDANFSIGGFHQLTSRLLLGNETAVTKVPAPEPLVSEAECRIETPVPSPLPASVPLVTQTPPSEPVANRNQKKGIFKSNKPEKIKKNQAKNHILEKAEPVMGNVGGKGFLIPGVENPVMMNHNSPKKNKTVAPEPVKKEKKSMFSFGKKKEIPELIVETKKAPAIVAPPVPPVYQSASPVPVLGNVGETTVLGFAAAGETTVLGSSAQSSACAWLIRKKTGEKIMVDKQVFRLGKEPTYVDYCIRDNTAVSRSHADILMKNQAYVIVDNNSLNHTYVNGIRLAPREEVPLMEGSTIILADEAFEFQVM